MAILSTLEQIIPHALEQRASDILLARGKVSLRIDGDVQPTDIVADKALFDAIIDAQMTVAERERAREALEGPEGASDFAMSVGGNRLRANIYQSQNGTCAALRPLPHRIPAPELLGLERQILDIVTTANRGLILINGPTGSGKSTTLAALIEHINANCPVNIITIEQPIEFLYTPNRATIQQREVGRDVNNFSEAVRAAMRQNPDIIVVGEIRDFATLSAALQSADTGHLVFGTLHTPDASTTVSRMLGMTPSADKGEIRNILASSIKMILCQRLFKRAEGEGRVAAREVLLAHQAISTLLREGKEGMISSTLLTHQAEGMVAWTTALRTLLETGYIDSETYTREIDPLQTGKR